MTRQQEMARQSMLADLETAVRAGDHSGAQGLFEELLIVFPATALELVVRAAGVDG